MHVHMCCFSFRQLRQQPSHQTRQVYTFSVKTIKKTITSSWAKTFPSPIYWHMSIKKQYVLHRVKCKLSVFSFILSGFPSLVIYLPTFTSQSSILPNDCVLKFILFSSIQAARHSTAGLHNDDDELNQNIWRKSKRKWKNERKSTWFLHTTSFLFCFFQHNILFSLQEISYISF